MKETKEQPNPIVQLRLTNPSTDVLRCSMQTVSVKHEAVTRRDDKNGFPIRENLYHHTLLFSQDTVNTLREEGKID